MHEVDPGYFGYWSKEEVAVFLNTLLERERIGTRAFADIGHAADLRIADLILSSRGLRCCASFCLPAVG